MLDHLVEEVAKSLNTLGINWEVSGDNLTLEDQFKVHKLMNVEN